MSPSFESLPLGQCESVYGIKPRPVRNAIRAGHVRAFKIGKKILVERQSLESWIQNHEITPAQIQAERSELQLLMDRAIQYAKKKTA